MKNRIKNVTAIGPASSANLGSGFDCFAIALDDIFDTVKISLNSKSDVIIKNISQTKNIPTQPNENTGGLVALNIIKEFNLPNVTLGIKKGVPPGKGLGSSAATASAVAVGLNKMFSLNLSKHELLKFAASGEIASAGVAHSDNVAGSLFGGFVVVSSFPKINIASFSPPKNLRVCIGIPKINTPPKKTGLARKLLPTSVKFSDAVINISNAAMMVAGFSKRDENLIGASMHDSIVEPARVSMIPNYKKIKAQVLKSGGLGMAISGAGPSVIVFVNTNQLVQNKIKKIIKSGFKSAGYNSSLLMTKIGKGARVIK